MTLDLTKPMQTREGLAARLIYDSLEILEQGLLKKKFTAVLDGITWLGNLWLASIVFIYTGIDVTER